MTQQAEPTHREKNIVIALLDGWKQWGDERDGTWYKERGKHKVFYNIDQFQYHSDWNQLMGCVEKIQNLKVYNLDGKNLSLMSDITVDIQFDGHYRKCRCGILGSITKCQTLSIPHNYEKIDTPHIWIGDKETCIEAVHEAVYQFIIWYNSTTNTVKL